MAKKKIYDIIYSAVVKHLRTKQGNVTSLPNDDQIQNGMRKIFRQLKDGGYNPVSADKVIKTESDLNAVLLNIKEKKMADIAARQKADEGITRVFYKMRNNIPLNPDDQAALQGSGFKTALDNFKGFEPKVIEGGRDLTMKTPGGEIPYIESPTQTIMQGGKKVPVKIPKGTKDDLLASFDNVNLTGDDTKYDADVLATDLAERRGFIKEGQDGSDMDQKDYSKLYSEAYSFLTRSRFLNKPKKAKGGIVSAVTKLRKKYGKDIIQKGKAPKDKGGRKKLRQMFKDFEKRTNKKSGGIIKFLKKLIGKKEKTRSEEFKDYLKRMREESDRMNKEFYEGLKPGGELDQRIEKIKKGYEFPGRKEIRKKMKERMDKRKLEKFDVEGRKPNAGGGLAYMLGEPRENFADGGMTRRTFLKIMAALAAFPVVGKLAKTTKVAKGIKPIVTPTAEMPAHFPKLVEKIIKEGQVVKKEFIKKTGDVTTYKHPDRPDIELTIEGDGKRIQLDFDTDQGMKGGYEFRQGDIIDDPASSMRGKRAPNEFDQGEVKYRSNQDGSYTKDFEEGIDTGTENLDEFAGVGKQKTSKSKVILNDEGEAVVRIDEDLADGGLAGLLGE